jgi:V/A-type H+-transporting ATPase subunit F
MVIADRDTALAFRAAGLETWPVTRKEARAAVVRGLERKDIGILLVTEEMADPAADVIEQWEMEGTGLTPLVITIPGMNTPERRRAGIKEQLAQILRA